MLVVLGVALAAVTPAQAQPAFSVSDLAGTWRVHILTGSGATDGPGSTLRGTIQVDATGAVLSGTLAHPDGSATTLTGGTFDITPLGAIVGSLTATGVNDAEIGDARMLVDRQVILGVISGGDLGDVGADFGLITLVKVTAGFTDDLVATWRYHELRTPDTVGQPPVSVVGEMVFDLGTITAGALTQSDGDSGTPAGAQATTADGTFTATVTGVGAPWQITGQVSSISSPGRRTSARPTPSAWRWRAGSMPGPAWPHPISPGRGGSMPWRSTARRATRAPSCAAVW